MREGHNSRSPDRVGDGILGGVGRCFSQIGEVCTARAPEQFGNESLSRLMRKCKRTGGFQESTPFSAGRFSLGVETKKRFPIGMRVYSLRLTRLHSSIEANRHSRSAALVLHLVRGEVASVSCGDCNGFRQRGCRLDVYGAERQRSGSNPGTASAGAVHACKTARRRQSRPSRGL